MGVTVRNRLPRIVALLLVATIAVSACSSAPDDAGQEPAGAAGTEAPEPTGAGGAEDGQGATPAGGQQTAGCEGEGGNFEGETVELVHGFSVGGGYDIYARSIATYLSEELGTDVIVVNKPGAGGMLATNETWAAAPDGTQLVLINASATIGADLAEAEGVRYESDQFSWIGRVSSEPNVAVSAASNDELQTFDDIVNAEEPVRFAATGAGSVEYLDPIFLREAFGLPIEVISGFADGPEAFQSVLAGDTDAQVRTMGSMLPPIEAGDANPLLVIGSGSPEQLPDVPTIFDLELEADPAVLEAHADLVETGRAIVGPPDMDPSALAELRCAYAAVAENEELTSQLEADGRPLSYMGGEEMQAVVEEILAAPESYVSILREAFQGAS